MQASLVIRRLASQRKKIGATLFQIAKISGLWPQTIASILAGRLIGSSEQLEKIELALRQLEQEGGAVRSERQKTQI